MYSNISLRANLNIQAKNGCTAFDIASIIGDTEVFFFFFDTEVLFPAYLHSNRIPRLADFEGLGK